ncbi:ACP S-malonyltransferase [Candidatus Daviesbacteria bacterium]|nr:ACP S-malonyltransferase [Candidatus Daviesbacteria bacterium]
MIEHKRFALLFPGQGAQKKGMGEKLYEMSPYARKVFDDADAICRRLNLGFDVTEVCFRDPKNQLTGDNADTAVIQPTLLTYCVATYTHLNKTGMSQPDILLGQSAGKYSALVASDSWDLEQGLEYVSKRGVVMKEAKDDLKAAAVLVVGLEYQRIQEELKRLQTAWGIPDSGIFFELTGVNTRLQSMIAGPRDRLQDVIKALKAEGARMVQEYKEAPPSHWRKLEPAQNQLNSSRLRYRKPRIKLLDDLTTTVMDRVEQLEISVNTHLIGPQLWIASMHYLRDEGFERAVEIGPGNLLQNIAQREYPGLKVHTTDSWENIEATHSFLTAET